MAGRPAAGAGGRPPGGRDACVRPPATDLRLAAAYMMASAFAFALMGAAVKVASQDVPATLSVFFRNAFGWVVLLPWAMHAGLPALRTRHFGSHLVRAVAGLAAVTCFFMALGSATLAEASVLYQAFPLFIPVIERVWLGQRVARHVVVALLVGFIGVLCVLRPGLGTLTSMAVVGTAAAAFAALAQVGIRRLTATEPVPRIVFYYAAIASTLSAVPLLWTWVTPSGPTWAALVFTGVSATVGQLFLTRAYSHAPAASVGPFIYVGTLFSTLIDWIVWDTPPDVWFAIGAMLIVVAGVALLRTRDAVDP